MIRKTRFFHFFSLFFTFPVLAKKWVYIHRSGPRAGSRPRTRKRPPAAVRRRVTCADCPLGSGQWAKPPQYPPVQIEQGTHVTFLADDACSTFNTMHAHTTAKIFSEIYFLHRQHVSHAKIFSEIYFCSRRHHVHRHVFMFIVQKFFALV